MKLQKYPKELFHLYRKHGEDVYPINISPKIVGYCGFLENLTEGDVVLADRGFTLHDSVGAELKIPPG